MASSSPVILILGAGANIGQSVARAFAAKGYKVALAARKANASDNTANTVNIQSDFSDPNSVVNVFSKVKETFGIPSVVVYNAAASSRADPKKPLSSSLSVSDFIKDMHINTTSVFVAAQQAAQGFEELSDSAAKTFIYTGNALNSTLVLAPLLTLGVGKSATAHLIKVAAESYGDQGFKFYYADERTAEGKPVYNNIDGDAHATHFLQLAEGKSQQPWLQTFAKGVGYRKFPLE